MPTLTQPEGLPASIHTEVTIRRCTVCKLPQPQDEFYTLRNSECKSCGRQRSRARYHRDKASLSSGISTQKCACGCGEFTNLSVGARGYKLGQPKRFKNGHARRLSPVEYQLEDRGYSTPCWVWQRAMGKDGYGLRGSRGAHIHYYISEKGPVPLGLVLDHLCRTRNCVNPDHLEPVTVAENTRRGDAAQLTYSEVSEIRRQLAAGQTQRELGRKFGVGQTTIGCIKRGVTWTAA